MWIYQVPISAVFFGVSTLLFCVSYFGYLLGKPWSSDFSPQKTSYLSEYFPSTILGTLALILGFTFSMTIGRFEARRKLVVDESNAIGTAYLRAGLLNPPNDAALKSLIKRHLDLRIAYYGAPMGSASTKENLARNAVLQKQIWETLARVTRKDRGALENSLAQALNSMFDLQNERNIALSKTLPPVIYWTILLISGLGLASLNFARAQRQEHGQWQPTLLIVVTVFVFLLVLDLERPLEGSIRISQDALTSLREQIDLDQSGTR